MPNSSRIFIILENMKICQGYCVKVVYLVEGIEERKSF